jgi:hypothetical protein
MVIYYGCSENTIARCQSPNSCPRTASDIGLTTFLHRIEGDHGLLGPPMRFLGTPPSAIVPPFQVALFGKPRAAMTDRAQLGEILYWVATIIAGLIVVLVVWCYVYNVDREPTRLCRSSLADWRSCLAGGVGMPHALAGR